MGRRLGVVLLLGIAILSQPHFCPVSNQASAEIKRKEGKTKEEIKKEKREMKRKLKPACPPGTEQVGDLPPDGTGLWCEYPTSRGRLTHGNYYKWQSNGNLNAEGEYYLGKKHGTWTTYHRDGRKKSVETWYDGKRQQQTRFDPNGQAIKEDETKSKQQSKKVRNRRPNEVK